MSGNTKYTNSMSGGVLADVCNDVNGENDVNMSGWVADDVCDDVNIGKDRSTSEGVPADMCSDVCNDVSTINDVNRSGCVVADVRIVSLNVSGLMSKMKYQEFCEMLVSNIICLTETKIDNLDSFACFMKNRSMYKRKSGGVGGGGVDSIASEKSDLKYGEDSGACRFSKTN